MSLVLTHTLTWVVFFAGLYGIVAVAERLQRGSWQSAIPAFAGTNREDDMQLSFEDALEGRDATLAAGDDRHKGWMALAFDAFAKVPDNWSGTFEDLRYWLTEHGLVQPKDPSVWGNLAGRLVKRGELVRTGERRPMRDPKARGRMTDVYRRSVVVEEAVA